MLVLVATVAVWAERNLLDNEGFSDNGVEAVRRDEVRSLIVEELVIQLEAAAPPELVQFRPVTEAVIETLMSGGAFERVYRQALREAHDALVSERGGTLVELSGIFLLVLAAIQEDFPQVAQYVPPNARDAAIEVQQRSWADDLLSLADRLRLAARVSPFLAAGALAAVVTASWSIRRGVILAGAAMVVGAVGALAAPTLAEPFVAPDFADPRRAEVFRVVWSVYTDEMSTLAIIVGGIGVGAMAVAAAGLPGLTPLEHLQRAAGFAGGWLGPEGGIARAAVLLVLGWIFVTRPEEVAEYVVIATGALILYIGVAELAHLARIAPEEGALPGLSDVRSVANEPVVRVAALGLLGLSVLGGTAASLYALGVFGTPRPPGVPATCNGHVELCDRPLDDVVFPATHNSMGALGEPGWFFADHAFGIPRQLEDGVRALLIDTHYGVDTGSVVVTNRLRGLSREELVARYGEEQVDAYEALAGGTAPSTGRDLFLCHGFCELGATELVPALREIWSFLERNRGEVLVIMIQDGITPRDTERAFEQAGLIPYLYHHPDPDAPWPTLKEMIDSNQRLVVFAEVNPSSDIEWYHDAFTLIQDTRFDFRSIEEFDCELNRGEPSHPLILLNHFTQGAPSDPRTANQFDVMYERALECEEERGQQVNFIAVDQYQAGDLFAVVDALNGVAEPDEDE